MPTPLKLGGHSLGSVQSHYILVVVVVIVGSLVPFCGTRKRRGKRIRYETKDVHKIGGKLLPKVP